MVVNADDKLFIVDWNKDIIHGRTAYEQEDEFIQPLSLCDECEYRLEKLINGRCPNTATFRDTQEPEHE